jgi:hypothetical protein
MTLKAAEPSRWQASRQATGHLEGEPSIDRVAEVVHRCLLDNQQPRLAVAKSVSRGSFVCACGSLRNTREGYAGAEALRDP